MHACRDHGNLNAVDRKRIPKAAGTFGGFDLRRNPAFRHPSDPWNHMPSSADGFPDIAAVRRGESRQVSCFLRGDHEPFPAKSKQGVLVVSIVEVIWTPFWSRKRLPLAIKAPAGELATRPKGKGDPGPLTLGSESNFAVVSYWCPSGHLELAVPVADAPLVQFCLDSIRRTPTSDE